MTNYIDPNAPRRRPLHATDLALADLHAKRLRTSPEDVAFALAGALFFLAFGLLAGAIITAQWLQ